jgi:cytosine/uracil/thiamine/allantoin permease
MKIRIPRPRLRVSQGESAFAAGNARWTNRDLDPIAKDRRKWGVSSLVGELCSLDLEST